MRRRAPMRSISTSISWSALQENELRTTLGSMGLHEVRQGKHYQKHLLRAESITNELRINRLFRMIETRTEVPPSVAEMARYLNVSLRHLERILQRTATLTPLQFSRRLRPPRALAGAQYRKVDLRGGLRVRVLGCVTSHQRLQARVRGNAAGDAQEHGAGRQHRATGGRASVDGATASTGRTASVRAATP